MENYFAEGTFAKPKNHIDNVANKVRMDTAMTLVNDFVNKLRGASRNELGRTGMIVVPSNTPPLECNSKGHCLSVLLGFRQKTSSIPAFFLETRNGFLSSFWDDNGFILNGPPTCCSFYDDLTIFWSCPTQFWAKTLNLLGDALYGKKTSSN
ncbi:hypothetical protein PIB30_081150 [Stylosanthes scabra]|uniref:Uncharacterized protein n=1 Tax=Stylosanthes scabra TaxID=79078 RepID=A0ABU6WRI0_9FABA|nr:hypothetical protein [Stylosanthes scabra]